MATQTDWKAQAKAALDERNHEVEVKKQQTRSQLFALMEQIVGTKIDKSVAWVTLLGTDTVTADIVHDGVHFRLFEFPMSPERGGLIKSILSIMRPCGVCDKEVSSSELEDKTDVGVALNEWEPRCLEHMDKEVV